MAGNGEALRTYARRRPVRFGSGRKPAIDAQWAGFKRAVDSLRAVDELGAVEAGVHENPFVVGGEMDEGRRENESAKDDSAHDPRRTPAGKGLPRVVTDTLTPLDRTRRAGESAAQSPSSTGQDDNAPFSPLTPLPPLHRVTTRRDTASALAGDASPLALAALERALRETRVADADLQFLLEDGLEQTPFPAMAEALADFGGVRKIGEASFSEVYMDAVRRIVLKVIPIAGAGSGGREVGGSVGSEVGGSVDSVDSVKDGNGDGNSGEKRQDYSSKGISARNDSTHSELTTYSSRDPKSTHPDYKDLPFLPREQAYHELQVTQTLAGLHRDFSFGLEALHCGVLRVHGVRFCRGYSEDLCRAWEAYLEHSETLNPSVRLYGGGQLFAVLLLQYGGVSLEEAELRSAGAAWSVFAQVSATLAFLEQRLCFEHRDLHWGNVLVAETPAEFLLVPVVRGGETHFARLRSHGVKAYVIDFTLARLRTKRELVFMDLDTGGGWLFCGQGDAQFDVYRAMRGAILCEDAQRARLSAELGLDANAYAVFAPHTNVLWLHYLLGCLLRRKRGLFRGQRGLRGTLAAVEKRILAYPGASEFCAKDESMSFMRSEE